MCSITEKKLPRAHPPRSRRIRRSSRPISGRRSRTMLEIKELVVNYGAISALHGISMTIEQGSIVTLVGANGAGKTTTLRAVSGLVKPRSGSIHFNGEEITGLAPHRVVG